MVYSREQSCVICMTPSKDNVLLCQDGHSGCRSCAESQSASDGCCPQCVGPLWKPDGEWVPNRVLNNLMVRAYEGKAAKQQQPNATGKTVSVAQATLNELKRAARRGAAAVVEPTVVEAQPEHSRQQQQRERAKLEWEQACCSPPPSQADVSAPALCLEPPPPWLPGACGEAACRAAAGGVGARASAAARAGGPRVAGDAAAAAAGVAAGRVGRVPAGCGTHGHGVIVFSYCLAVIVAITPTCQIRQWIDGHNVAKVLDRTSWAYGAADEEQREREQACQGQKYSQHAAESYPDCSHAAASDPAADGGGG